MSDWRDLQEETRAHFILDLQHSMRQRQELGIAAYGNTFEGDPLQHAWQELLDACFYLWVEAQRQGVTLKGGQP